MAELSLPERLVHAAETGIREAAIDVAAFPLGDKAYGYVHDFGTRSAAALIIALADDYRKKVLCPAGVRCQKCRVYLEEGRRLRGLAEQARDVPALEEV